MTEAELLTTSIFNKRKLDDTQSKAIYKAYKQGATKTSLAKEYNVSKTTISREIERRKYALLPAALRNAHYGGANQEKWAKLAKANHKHLIEKWCK